MPILTLDFETYYDNDFSLKKLTTEEYIRDKRFEVIGVGVKVGNDKPEWITGTHEEITRKLKWFSWPTSMVLAHNTMFDGAILEWAFGIKPKAYLDTMCMGRALHGIEASASLEALAQRENVGQKGFEIRNALGMRREEFTPQRMELMANYCLNDVELTHRLFTKWVDNFPTQELKIIDLTLKMFIRPALQLDKQLLTEHLQEVQTRKAELLDKCGATTDVLMSNPKFADLLRTFGVTPPTKISQTTGKETLAFAKNDEEFVALAKHPDWRVQALVNARLGAKSTLEETRTQRFLGIAERGALPVPIRYYAAHTGRFGGDDKINMQNLPSRGENAGKLKKAILAPEGHVVIDADSSQIEARVLAWLAGQNDLVEIFRKNNEEILAGIDKKEFKYDPYKLIASSIYSKPTTEITTQERFVGKTTLLGSGYGMGAVKFQAQLKTFGTDISIEEARRIIDIYRSTNPAIVSLWREAQLALIAMYRRESATLGLHNVVYVEKGDPSICLPSGLRIRYDGIKVNETEKGVEFTYQTRKGPSRVYGGKIIENVCQAVARCVIAEQMLRISKRYRVVLTVHDAIACVAPEDEAETAQKYVEACMRWVPDWAPGLPLNCESGVGKSYGDC